MRQPEFIDEMNLSTGRMISVRFELHEPDPDTGLFSYGYGSYEVLDIDTQIPIADNLLSELEVKEIQKKLEEYCTDYGTYDPWEDDYN